MQLHVYLKTQLLSISPKIYLHAKVVQSYVTDFDSTDLFASYPKGGLISEARMPLSVACVYSLDLG